MAFIDPVLDSIDAFLAWIGSSLGQTTDYYCSIETADSRHALVSKDGSLVSIIRIHGATELVGPSEFQKMHTGLINTLSPALARSGHALQVYFHYDKELVKNELKEILRPAVSTASRLKLDLSDLFEERINHLSKFCSSEACYFAPDELGLGEEGLAAEPVAYTPEKKKSHFFPIVIVLAILGFIGYKLYPKFFKQQPPKEIVMQKTEPVAVPKAAATPSPMPTPAAPVTSMPSIELPSAVPPEQQALEKLQQKLEETQKANQQRIQTLENNLATMTQHSENANKAINIMQRDLNTITATNQTLENRIKVIVEEIARIRQELVVKKAPPPPVHHKPKHTGPSAHAIANPSYNVYAIIPGRAWLRTAHGKTITVTDGDSVGEYGKVLKIDATNGVVVTSSGVTLR